MVQGRLQLDGSYSRKDFLPSEAVAIGRAVEKKEEEAAKKRQKEGGKKAGRGRPSKGGATNGTTYPKQKARDQAAAVVGVSLIPLDIVAA